MSAGSPYVVIAEFRVKSDCLDDFLAAAADDAAHSLADEPGCRQFDIVVPDGDDGAVIFYEVYDDRAAFEAHLETPHLARFRAAFPPMIRAELPVRFGRLLELAPDSANEATDSGAPVHTLHTSGSAAAQAESAQNS